MYSKEGGVAYDTAALKLPSQAGINVSLEEWGNAPRGPQGMFFQIGELGQDMVSSVDCQNVLSVPIIQSTRDPQGLMKAS